MAKFKQGYYNIKNIEKYIFNKDKKLPFYRSSWEKKFMLYCDMNPGVLKWSSETIVIPYFYELDQKMHRYFIDFFIRIKDANGNIRNILIEVKPKAETKEPKKPKKLTEKTKKNYMNAVATFLKNKAKWEAASKFAKENNMEFLILTEHELGI